ncbi:MAG: MBL fold metallo-hydrolase [Candidatus Eisenbacteria bacterium]
MPKPLWSRFSKADRENRIPLVVRSLVVRSGRALAIIDPGMGGRYDSADLARMAVDPSLGSLAATLRRQGIPPEEITHAVLTHLHFDHIAGLGRAEGTGVALELPQAKVLIHRRQWERAQAPGPKERRSYRPEDIDLLRRADPVLIDGAAEVLPGLFVSPTEGHTRGLMAVEVRGSKERIFYPTDLIPTLAHIRLPFTTGFDLWPEQLLIEKEAILSAASRPDAWIAFVHDPRTAAAGVVHSDEGYTIRERLAEF